MRNECPRCGSDFTHLSRRSGMWECEDCGYRFEGAASSEGLTKAELERPAERPVRVFLSYPRSSREICVMIRDALRARGHDVWFAEERIHEGDDWRVSIAEGIGSHRTLISYLTREAIREGDGTSGVCLDELSIAFSTPGCVVQPVLLEPADVVRPTAAVAHRQWLDMSAWREVRGEGEERFRAWFSERMLRLFEVVESEEPRAFAGEMEELHGLLPLARQGTGREGLLVRSLEGRAWIARQLESWLDDPQGGSLCALWRDPGVGKSTFSVHYAIESDRVAASVSLSYGDVRYATMSAFAQTLAYQLACRLPDYRAELIRVLHGTSVAQVRPSEVADLLFIGPLTKHSVDSSHEVVCVLVDGLDECAGCECVAAVALLRLLRNRAPRWLRLIVAARPDPDLVTVLRPDHELWLRGEAEENMADVAAFLEKKLKEVAPDAAERQDLVHALAERSRGVFHFAEAFAESARLGGSDALEPASLPSTLDEALIGYLARAFPDLTEYARRFRPLIGAMLASPVPLPEAELSRLLGATESDVGDLRMRAGALLERGEDDFGEPTLSIAHHYVAKWLASDRAGRYKTYPREALRTMALACHRISSGDTGSLTGYEAANAVALCGAPCLSEKARELCRSRGLAIRLTEYANSLFDWGKYARASELHRLALEVDKLRASELGTPEARRDLSVTLGRVGDLARERGDLAAAGDAYDRSVENYEVFVSELDTPDARRDLSVALERVGDVAFERGDIDAAGNAWERSLFIDECLVFEIGVQKAWPHLSAALDKVGDLAHARGELKDARDQYVRALEIRETLASELDTPGA